MSDNRAFAMLNALWFKPEGGRERYYEYLKATGPISARYGAVSTSRYLPEHALIGEFDADMVFFVEWPSPEAFDQFLNDPEYAPVRELREQAITKSLLIRCAIEGKAAR